ncbi:MAG: GNAT family N-acetyltransferase [Clostridiales bacterium]|jgi:predicted N-acetyltransferase YhbS|nr:GNAT family N-acetyltransferase [Clostridiales bacterium]
MTEKIDFNIRPETPEDSEQILKLTFEAFQTIDHPKRKRMDEHYLVALMADDDTVFLRYVAEKDGEIIGHIVYTKSAFTRPDGSKAETATFGPLSVLPEYQKMGVGKALVFASLADIKAMGYHAVIISGVPAYYPKLGFKRGRDFGLIMSDGTAEDFFMAYELTEGYLNGGGVYDTWSPSFDKAEEDDEGFGAFHKKFISRHYKDKTMLRLFYDNDVALLEHWLFAGHVSKWYAEPEDWLAEVRGRRGEFSFIKHFIAEYNARPIGFCQYYDCFDAKKYDIDWHIDIPEPGKVFSIDYLIGDPADLRRGHAKKIVLQLLEKIKTHGAETVIVLPDNENAASNSLLAACGFTWDGERHAKRLN